MALALGVLAACLVLSFPVYRIIAAWSDRRLGAGEACAALFLMVVFVAGVMATWGRPANVALWLLLIALAAAIVLGTRVSDRRRLERFFEEDVAAAQRALEAHPDNAAAHMRLGELYAARGEFEAAIQHYEAAARLVASDAEVKSALARVIEKRRLAVTGNLVCWRCGRENAASAGTCRGCGAVISDRNQVVEWLCDAKATRVLRWLGVLCLALTIAATAIPGVPGVLTVLLYALLLALVLCYVYPRWARARS